MRVVAALHALIASAAVVGVVAMHGLAMPPGMHGIAEHGSHTVTGRSVGQHLDRQDAPADHGHGCVPDVPRGLHPLTVPAGGATPASPETATRGPARALVAHGPGPPDLHVLCVLRT